MNKACARCKVEKNEDQFWKNRVRKGGLSYYCKDCHRATLARDPQLAREAALRFYSTVKGRYAAYKGDAKRRGVVWDISQELFATFWQKECVYCGENTKIVGLDRIDNSAGYTEGNVQSCCTACNLMKRGWSDQEFKERVKKIAARI